MEHLTQDDHTLLRNLPQDDEGNVEWHWFGEGPPDYLVYFMEELERRDAKTKPVIEKARRRLGISPLWEHLPEARKMLEVDKCFINDSNAWDAACAVSAAATSRPA